MLNASNSGTSNDDNNASLKKFNSQESRKNAFSKALSSVFEKYKETSTVIRQNNQVIANNANAVAAHNFQPKVLQQRSVGIGVGDGSRFYHLASRFFAGSNLNLRLALFGESF